MALNFPNSPTIGDEFTGGGFTWTWTGNAWEKVAAASGGIANDFVLVVGNSGNTTYVLDRVYSAGSYVIDFANNDTTYDIYFIAEDGSYAGYTNGTTAIVSASFEEVVVIGAATNETIIFTYQGTSTTPTSAGDKVTAGAFITSVVTSALPNINDTTVINGGNFASNVQISFIGQNSIETAAKNVVRSSSTQLVATRPDALTTAQSPYTIKALNPGIPAPTGSNRHLLSNAITAGTNPSWVTGTTLTYNLVGSNSFTLLATDTEASDIDYTIVSGTLPSGFSLNEETGLISGTFSGTASDGDSTNVTFRATDAGGNFVDRTISFIANAAPVWTTTAGALSFASEGNAYSFQLVANSGTAGGALTYTLQSGNLPNNLTLSSSGLISGTMASGTAGTTSNFTVRVTDTANAFTDRAFSITVASLWQYIVVAGGGGSGTAWNDGAGGGGAGGYRSSVAGESSGGGTTSETSIAIALNTNYVVTVGAGGTMYSQGGNSVFGSVTSIGGGVGSPSGGAGGFPGGNGGSGGGGGAGQLAGNVGVGGNGTAGQGFNGGNSQNNSNDRWAGGGGGGAGAVGQNAPTAGTGGAGGTGVASSITGSSVFRAGGGGGAGFSNGDGGTGGGGSDGSNGSANTGGGAGGLERQGGSGIVIIRYPASRNITVGAGLTSSTSTVGSNKVTTFTAGTGNVSWS